MLHHREDRRAYIHFWWLAPLLIRVVENATADTRRSLHRELYRVHCSPSPLPTGRARMASTIPGQLAALGCPSPPRFFFEFALSDSNG